MAPPVVGAFSTNATQHSVCASLQAACSKVASSLHRLFERAVSMVERLRIRQVPQSTCRRLSVACVAATIVALLLVISIPVFSIRNEEEEVFFWYNYDETFGAHFQASRNDSSIAEADREADPDSILMFNTWEGDKDFARIQCRYHPTAYFCANSDPHAFSQYIGGCKVVTAQLHYSYEHNGYKKLQCIDRIRRQHPGTRFNLLTADVDSGIHETVLTTLSSYTANEIANSTAPQAVCDIDPKMRIYHRMNKRWFVFRKDPRMETPFRGCRGWLVYMPAHVVDFLFDRLAYFEHFHADDVAFTWFLTRYAVGIVDFNDGSKPWVPEEVAEMLQTKNGSAIVEWYESRDMHSSRSRSDLSRSEHTSHTQRVSP